MLSIKVPPLGESIVEATVARWLRGEGEDVAAGDTLVELETDKITVEVPAPKAGRLVRQLHGEGDAVKVDDALAQFDESAAAASGAPAAVTGSARAPAGNAPAASAARTSAPVASAPAAPPAAPPRSSPAVRRIAAEAGVDLAGVTGSGRRGHITKADVLDVAARAPAPSGPASAPTPANAGRPAPLPAPAPRGPANGARETREPMSTRRRRIAEHLLEAQHATAHLTTFNEVDMSAVMALRDRLRDRIEQEHGVRLTYMPFFARAAIHALTAYPAVNAQIEGDAIVYRHYVNLGIAVASDQGLVVPVVRDADRMGMIEFSRAMSALATRARDGKLAIDDLTGGTFTITNGGVFGSLVSTPILNYPQVGILGLHKIQERPVAVDGQVVIRPMMYIALSYDHRLVEGQQAVLFLVRIKALMEDPAAMLVE